MSIVLIPGVSRNRIKILGYLTVLPIYLFCNNNNNNRKKTREKKFLLFWFIWKIFLLLLFIQNVKWMVLQRIKAWKQTTSKSAILNRLWSSELVQLHCRYWLESEYVMICVGYLLHRKEFARTKESIWLKLITLCLASSSPEREFQVSESEKDKKQLLWDVCKKSGNRTDWACEVELSFLVFSL